MNGLLVQFHGGSEDGNMSRVPEVSAPPAAMVNEKLERYLLVDGDVRDKETGERIHQYHWVGYGDPSESELERGVTKQ